IRHNDVWIFSHPEFKDGLRERMEALLASVPVAPVPESRKAQEQVTMHNSLYVRERAKLYARGRKS
ncbi:MAG: hypothetical protein RLZZ393_1482, partial [Pseudomonadota bacterium]